MSLSDLLTTPRRRARYRIRDIETTRVALVDAGAVGRPFLMRKGAPMIFGNIDRDTLKRRHATFVDGNVQLLEKVAQGAIDTAGFERDLRGLLSDLGLDLEPVVEPVAQSAAAATTTTTPAPQVTATPTTTTTTTAATTTTTGVDVAQMVKALDEVVTQMEKAGSYEKTGPSDADGVEKHLKMLEEALRGTDDVGMLRKGLVLMHRGHEVLHKMRAAHAAAHIARKAAEVHATHAEHAHHAALDAAGAHHAAAEAHQDAAATMAAQKEAATQLQKRLDESQRELTMLKARLGQPAAAPVEQFDRPAAPDHLGAAPIEDYNTLPKAVVESVYARYGAGG